MLASLLQVACPTDLVFERNEHGKPRLAALQQLVPASPTSPLPLPLHFNLSHTADLIGCAVCVGQPLGLDVEPRRRQPHDLMAVARRRLTASELALLSR